MKLRIFVIGVIILIKVYVFFNVYWFYFEVNFMIILWIKFCVLFEIIFIG